MAVIPVDDVKALIEDNWDDQSGTVPDPIYVVMNNGLDPERHNLNNGDYINFRTGVPTETEQPIGTWIYGHRVWPIVIEMYTKNSRDRLWEMKDEIRRICHAQMHSMTNFQRIQYKQFSEIVDEEFLVWQGRIELELVSNAVFLETSN